MTKNRAGELITEIAMRWIILTIYTLRDQHLGTYGDQEEAVPSTIPLVNGCVHAKSFRETFRLGLTERFNRELDRADGTWLIRLGTR